MSNLNIELEFKKIFQLWLFYLRWWGFKSCQFGQLGTINSQSISCYTFSTPNLTKNTELYKISVDLNAPQKVKTNWTNFTVFEQILYWFEQTSNIWNQNWNTRKTSKEKIKSIQILQSKNWMILLRTEMTLRLLAWIDPPYMRKWRNSWMNLIQYRKMLQMVLPYQPYTLFQFKMFGKSKHWRIKKKKKNNETMKLLCTLFDLLLTLAILK